MARIFKNNRPANVDYHTSVLKEEAINFLDIKPGGKYIDCTLGSGGHAVEIIKRGGIVLGIDTDDEAIEYVRENLKVYKNLTLVKGNFRDLAKIAKSNNFAKVDGILYDLGVSTHQLKAKGRGFSFALDEDLDMRMDKSLGITAKDVVNRATKEELYEIFTKFGEERRAWAIADAIVRARQVSSIFNTKQLAEIILSVRGKMGFKDRTHPATRTFQALRIHVNDELERLKNSLAQTLEILKRERRLVIISFHSLEDRIVKNFIRQQEFLGDLKNLTPRPIRPSEMEINRNPSARSGKLRAAVKI